MADGWDGKRTGAGRQSGSKAKKQPSDGQLGSDPGLARVSRGRRPEAKGVKASSGTRDHRAKNPYGRDRRNRFGFMCPRRRFWRSVNS